MLIVSKFNDYYDTAAMHGIDKTCVYNRESVNTEVNIKHRHIFAQHKYRYSEAMPIRRFVIGFCGRLYPGAIATVKCNRTWKEIDFIVYNQKDLETVIKDNGYDVKKRIFGRWDRIKEDEFWNPNTWNFLEEKFRELNVPVFCVIGADGKAVLRTNPTLKNLAFFKVRSAPETFQEIFMYISGVLGTGERETVEIDDKIMLHKKGFDEKSFKKEPGKKRGKKK